MKTIQKIRFCGSIWQDESVEEFHKPTNIRSVLSPLTLQIYVRIVCASLKSEHKSVTTQKRQKPIKEKMIQTHSLKKTPLFLQTPLQIVLF